jgi:predicted ATP-grasp superfamily ATP-dependent carboligase
MNIMVAEYAVGAGEGGTILLEGKAMLNVLVSSFTKAGHNVIYPTTGPVIPHGTEAKTNDLKKTIAELASHSDAALVIAPDELLSELTQIIEDNTINLGCPSKSVTLCADKLLTSTILAKGAINVPKTATGKNQDMFLPDECVVVKPRWGCASEDTTLTVYGELSHIPDGFVATQYIQGEHLSVSLVIGDNVLPLSVNRQNIKIGSSIQYDGNVVGIDSGRNPEVIEVAQRSARLLGCRGYVGVDIVLADDPWVIDVNPRPTTSIIGIDRVVKGELGELILKARFGGLPECVELTEEFFFTKGDLENL